MATNQNTKRKDKARVVLRKGESQRKDGKYDFRWTSPDGKRHSIYAATLEEFREKENDIQRDSLEGIKAEARYVTLNDMFTLWAKVKRGLKDNTFQNYLYLYRQFVEPDFGKSKVSALKKSDVKQFYNTLADERGLQISTIDSVHTVLHQVLDMAVDDCYLRSNPSDNVLRELKKAHRFETNRRKALTVTEQNLLLSYLSKTPKYQHWYPIFAVMLGTGLRVGEATGLRWCDVDLEEGTISVNHTLVNYDHRENNGGKKGCYFNCHSPKTKAGVRTVPMMDFVKEAFEKERAYQEEAEIHIVSAPLVAVPDFRVVELTDHGNILLQLRKGTQVCGNEDAALCVELCIERIGEVVALDASCLFAVAERADLVLQTLPFRFRIDGQAAIEALGDREVLAELLAQLGRHCQTTLSVYGMLIFALHSFTPALPLWWNL